jgi:anti-sigma factor RsiW
MNCFEVRKGFVALWRKELTPEQRQELSAHLRGCARCDRSFRLFALSAPVLYSESEPVREVSEPGAREFSYAARTYRDVAAPGVAAAGAQAWVAVCAALSMVVAAGFAAYLATAVPRQTLDDTLTTDQWTTQLFSQREQPPPLPTNNLAG